MQFGPGAYKKPLSSCVPQLSPLGTRAEARGQRAPGKAAPPTAGRGPVPPGRGRLRAGLWYRGGWGEGLVLKGISALKGAVFLTDFMQSSAT